MLGVSDGQISIIDWLDRPPIDFLHIGSLQDPIAAQGRKPLRWVMRHAWIAPWPAGVVNAHRLVYFNLAGHCFGRR
jgi:hypothetical protein